MLGLGFFFIVMSKFGSTGEDANLGLLVGGLVIVVVSGIYLVVKRKG